VDRQASASRDQGDSASGDSEVNDDGCVRKPSGLSSDETLGEDPAVPVKAKAPLPAIDVIPQEDARHAVGQHLLVTVGNQRPALVHEKSFHVALPEAEAARAQLHLWVGLAAGLDDERPQRSRTGKGEFDAWSR
jgi:hypothetical protein